MQIIDDWLEDWLFQVPAELEACAEPHDRDAVARLAQRLRQEAALEGYSEQMLQLACRGDVEAFLTRETELVALRKQRVLLPTDRAAPSITASV